MKKVTLWAGRLIPVCLVLIAVFVCTQVDDWGRDLITNYAGIEVTVENKDRNECIEATKTAINGLGWTLLDETPTHCVFHAVRTSSLGFKDDIFVYFTGMLDGSTIIRFWSSSRTGFADLGQNPRNIVKLIKAIDKEL